MGFACTTSSSLDDTSSPAARRFAFSSALTTANSRFWRRSCFSRVHSSRFCFPTTARFIRPAIANNRSFSASVSARVACARNNRLAALTYSFSPTTSFPSPSLAFAFAASSQIARNTSRLSKPSPKSTACVARTAFASPSAATSRNANSSDSSTLCAHADAHCRAKTSISTLRVACNARLSLSASSGALRRRRSLASSKVLAFFNARLRSEAPWWVFLRSSSSTVSRAVKSRA